MYLVSDVTIIIPAHCTTDESLTWLEECLYSALSQGCPVVVVSDASPKPIDEVIATVWRENLTYQSVPVHMGVSAARNRAVRIADTRLILPLDCDDTLKTGAVKKLVENFEGVPLYPDITKFGAEEVPHYQLLNFDCDLLYSKVGLSSVNVLHTKEQWRTVGGWDEKIDFYEDGEYNARLMLAYCGKRLPLPLVNYRIHPGQRTRTNSGRSKSQGQYVLSLIKEHPTMCCGKDRKNLSSSMIAQQADLRRSKMNVDVTNLPGTQGDRVLARYIGGRGKGKHYYRGVKTNFPYKVKYGGAYYVDPSDTKSEGDSISRSLFVLVPMNDEKIDSPIKIGRPIKREKRAHVEKTPVVEEPLKEVEEKVEPLPDITNLVWAREIRHMDFTPEVAEKLLEIEESGKNRVKVKKHLKKFLKN